MTYKLDNKEVGALLYLLGIEIGRLRTIQDSDTDEEVLNNEINFYKQLAFKLNTTI